MYITINNSVSDNTASNMECPLSHFLLLHKIVVTVFALSIAEKAFAFVPGNQTDKLALLAFKSQVTEDTQEVLASWNASQQFCRWAGITCGLKHQRVTALNLADLKLAGTVAPHIGNLSFLHVLNLADNSFHGIIPPELGNLIRLQSLNLSYNLLDGEIPSRLSHCGNLSSLLLDHNYLEGYIPPELGSLSKLVMLYLKNNNLTGQIPPSIGNLTFVQELYMSYNELEGQVPDTIAQLKSLVMLGLSVNSLSGEFPSALYNLSSLKLIGLSFNNFTGTLRDNIGLAFPYLQRLYLGGNHFTGKIPVSLSNASHLLQLDVPLNNFTGTIPGTFKNLQDLLWINVHSNHLGWGSLDDLSFLNSLANCSKLHFLDFADNHFSDTFPISITNLSVSLTTLLMGGNRIHGNIPEEISILINLNVFSVKNAFLTGKIPSSLGKLLNLKTLNLQSNQLIGRIPSSLGNVTGLLRLYLEDNSLEGSIPSSLGNCAKLQRLDLSQNKLNGTIPRQVLIGLSSISVLFNVSYNSLTGLLPVEVGNLTNLAALDISNNKLSGEIPNELGNCIALVLLSMQNNHFEGTIRSLGSLKNLQYLYLSNNNLSGQIPTNIAKLSSLIYLNLSYNNLEGEVPGDGVFKNLEASEMLGNPKLCSNIQELKLRPCPKQASPNHKKHIHLKLILIIVGIVAGLALLLSSVSLLWKKKSQRKPQSTTFGSFFPQISYEVLLNATGGFSSTNFIGSGSFGNVYKGVIPPDETLVAVKVLKLNNSGASKSFLAECITLRNIRHRNLVKVLTACSSIDFEGNDFRALVYQYMPNGSLEEWLHPNDEQEQQKSLSILQRINIAIDVASALQYLHNQCGNQIVHCDLKPSNILLDNDLTAHVGDFGLARILFNSCQDAVVNQFSSLGIKGTIGYAAPEYGMGGLVSVEGDVYSYGILLLEMFTGKRPTDELFKDNSNLHSFVKKALPDGIMDIMDQTALQSEEEWDGIGKSWWGNEQIECLISVFEIGISCSEEAPQGRISMRDVLMHLNSVRDKFMQGRNGLGNSCGKS